MNLLIDVGACCDAHTDSTLEHLHKAIGEGDPDTLWNPHHSPFISRMIELFTQRGLMRLDGFRNELTQWLAGERHVEGHRIPHPGMMDRWTDSEIKLVKLYLEAIPPAEMTLDDYMLCVDMLVQKYLPADALRTESEWLATRSVLMGRVQANMAALTAKQADVLLETLPTTVAAAEEEFQFTPVQRAVLGFANARAAENVVELASTTRHAMKVLIQRKLESDALGSPSSSLESQLFDKFADLNKDWRRIALTESGESQVQGYIASLAPGTFVRRIERYKGACPFCRSIDGRVMEVVSPDSQNKDGATQIWVGKNNVGRSASPRRRQAGILIERQPDEMYWVPAGLAHPNCRGSYLPEITGLPGEDAEFGKYLRETLRNK